MVLFLPPLIEDKVLDRKIYYMRYLHPAPAFFMETFSRNM